MMLEIKYTKILEVNLFAFACRLLHEDFSPIDGAQIHRAYWYRISSIRRLGVNQQIMRARRQKEQRHQFER